MRIQGVWGAFGAAYVRAIVVSDNLQASRHVRFLIDTGASRTTILDADAVRLGIRYDQLQKFAAGTTGIGGVVDTYVIPDVKLLFIADGNIHEEQLPQLFVLRHAPKSVEEAERINKIPSLLGRDVFSKYRLILDRPENLVVITDQRE
jgi:hypothetical protein